MKMNNIMKQAQELQKKLQLKQEELASQEFEASSGGGMVMAKVNGKGEVLSVFIEPDVINKDDRDLLQDLVIAAVNEALRRVQEAQQDQMANMVGGLGLKIPGLS